MDDKELLSFLQNSTKEELIELLININKDSVMYKTLKEKIEIEFS